MKHAESARLRPWLPQSERSRAPRRITASGPAEWGAAYLTTNSKLLDAEGAEVLLDE